MRLASETFNHTAQVSVAGGQRASGWEGTFGHSRRPRAPLETGRWNLGQSGGRKRRCESEVAAAALWICRPRVLRAAGQRDSEEERERLAAAPAATRGAHGSTGRWGRESRPGLEQLSPEVATKARASARQDGDRSARGRTAWPRGILDQWPRARHPSCAALTVFPEISANWFSIPLGV